MHGHARPCRRHQTHRQSAQAGERPSLREERAIGGTVEQNPKATLTMTKSTEPDVTALMREYPQRATLRAGNSYRARAYARAADSLAAVSAQAMQSPFARRPAGREAKANSFSRSIDLTSLGHSSLLIRPDCYHLESRRCQSRSFWQRVLGVRRPLFRSCRLTRGRRGARLSCAGISVCGYCGRRDQYRDDGEKLEIDYRHDFTPSLAAELPRKRSVPTPSAI
jgi:hypothetical protein